MIQHTISREHKLCLCLGHFNFKTVYFNIYPCLMTNQTLHHCTNFRVNAPCACFYILKVWSRNDFHHVTDVVYIALLILNLKHFFIKIPLWRYIKHTVTHLAFVCSSFSMITVHTWLCLAACISYKYQPKKKNKTLAMLTCTDLWNPGPEIKDMLIFVFLSVSSVCMWLPFFRKIKEILS